MPKIYISYRRDDSAPTSGRLYDRLAAIFGAQSLFMDVDKIAPGLNFVEAIRQEIELSDVIIVLIGPRWFTSTNQAGLRRIEDPEDFVRREIAFAIQLAKPLIPVLLDSARFPPVAEFPEELKPLALHNHISISHETFHRDVDRLVSGIRGLLQSNASEIEVRENEPISVFLSHSAADRDWVESEIVEFLKGNRISPWYSAQSISTAAQWEREILKGMEACEWFSLVVSPAAAESDWVKDELFWAMQHRPTRIVPIIMSHCDLYKFHIRLPRIQHVDFTVSRSIARQKLLTSFRSPRGQSDSEPSL